MRLEGDHYNDDRGNRREVPFPIDGNTNTQMGQIANVFYNVLNMVGVQNNDKRMLKLSSQLRD